MSATIAAASSRTPKSTCPHCGRTIVVVEVGGAKVATDPELMSIVLYNVTPPRKALARRVHAEMCDMYQASDRRLKILAEQRRYTAAAKRKP